MIQKSSYRIKEKGWLSAEKNIKFGKIKILHDKIFFLNMLG